MTDSGIYIRVRAENMLLEDMSKEERQLWLDDLDREALCRTIHHLCDTITDLKEKEKEIYELKEQVEVLNGAIEKVCNWEDW